MQRRAAAIYFVFFLVIGVGAYASIGVVQSQQPHVSLDAPIEGGANSSFTVGGQEYTISSIEQESSSGGGASIVGELAWTNESARSTGELANGSNVSYQDRRWQVVIANESDVSEFTLNERVNVTRELRADPDVQNETARYQGEPWVVWAENETLNQPLAEWLPAPEEETITLGQTFPYEGNEDAEIVSVTPSAATVAWTEASENTAELAEGGNVTIQGRTYFVHFPDNSTVQLAPVYSSPQENQRSAAYSNYQNTLDRQDYFTERKNGLWGISIISLTAALILLGAAYMPVKD
jgi:hypothetical protein